MRWAELELGAVISEALKFVGALGYPMGHRVPHIYLSALPPSPAESIALQFMCRALCHWSWGSHAMAWYSPGSSEAPKERPVGFLLMALKLS